MIVQPSVAVIENTNVTITCSAEKMNSLLNATIRWIKNNQTLPTEETKTTDFGHETIKSVLNLRRTQSSQSGLYECSLTTDLNDHITASTPVKIEGNQPMWIISILLLYSQLH